MSISFRQLWGKLRDKRYREEFVASQVKRGIPFQIRTLMEQREWSQEKLALESGLTQGVISRAANPEYGNLTINTIIRIAAGFDVAFIGKFVPFTELGKWFTELSEESVRVPDFQTEDGAISVELCLGKAETALDDDAEQPQKIGPKPAGMGSALGDDQGLAVGTR